MSQLSTVVNLRRPAPRSSGIVGEEITLETIEETCAFLQHEIFMSKLKYNAIAARAGCCAQTVSNMAAGETRQPRHSTVLAIFRVLGFQQVWRR